MNLSGVFLPWASLVVSLAIVASINGLEFALKIQALRAVLAQRSDDMLDSTRPLRLKFGAMTFEELSDVYGVESDDDWAALVHRGIGFLYPQASETLHIGSNISVYGVSAFHQLHCVDMLRKFYNYAKRGELEAYAAQEMHMLHCFNYLRQGILCAADTTLEPDYWKIEGPGKISPLPRNSSKGVGSKHRCRDASPLWKATIQSNTTFSEALQLLNPET